MTETPSTRERRALEHLRTHETVHALSGVGPSTIRDMLQKDWIEPIDPVFNIGGRYRLTTAGKAALSAPIMPKARSKPTLTTLQPRLNELPPRIGNGKKK